jgi:hypothetical protein
MTDYIVPMYATYLAATIGLVVWLARTLYRNGAVFLRDVFDDRPEMADAVNHLLVTGFAMLNLGYGFFLLDADGATDAGTAVVTLTRRLGVLLVTLAAVHFLNVFVFHRIAARRRQAVLVPPVAPQRWVDGFEPPAGEPSDWSRPAASHLPPPPARPGAGFGPAPA